MGPHDTPMNHSIPLRDRFLSWVAQKGDDRYRLYRWFLRGVSGDEAFWHSMELMVCHLPQRKQYGVHYIYMAAVQYLAMQEADNSLRKFFPWASESPAYAEADCGAEFARFARHRHTDLCAIVEQREVQINKLGRNALIAPLFLGICNTTPGPKAFVEIGSSIGVGLLWPRLNFEYGVGSIRSMRPLATLNCEVRGDSTSFAFDGTLPIPHLLCGIEPYRLSTGLESDVAWLMALTAPDDSAGRSSIAKGIALVRSVHPDIRTGCVLEQLPKIASTLDREVPLVVYHAMTMHHLREEDKESAFVELLLELSSKRTVWEVSVEWTTGCRALEIPRPVEISMTAWIDGAARVEVCGETDASADGRFICLRRR